MRLSALLSYPIAIVIAMFVVAGCQTNGRPNHQASGADTIYTEAAAMSIHRTEPERALVMIDSALIVGNITWQRAEYLKAVTQYGGLHNLPLSRQTCLDMIKRDEELRKSDKDARTDSVTLERTYLLLTSIEYTAANHPAIIRYATEASRLAHALDMPDEVGKMEAFIARAMAQTGRTDEGIERLRKTLADLRELNTFGGVVSYHDASKKLLHILIDHGRFSEMEQVCHDVLDRLGELEAHPDRFGDMVEGFNPAEYIDFARGQMLAFLTTAYARQVTEHKDDPTLRAKYLRQALDTEKQVFTTSWSRGIDCDKMLSAAYHHLGQFDRFEQAMQRFENTYPDTINPNYLICLEQRSEACKMQGRLAESLSYRERASVVRDSLDQRNQRDQLAELATVYHLQEERLARQQAESDTRIFRLLTATIACGLVAAIAFAIYFFYKRREITKKNRVLAREITKGLDNTTLPHPIEAMVPRDVAVSPSMHDPTPSSAVGTGDTPAASAYSTLYQQLRDTILREQLYLEPRLDRQTLVDRFGVSKDRIGAAFAKGSPYKSLIDFLTDCRLPYAAKLLASRPDLSIADVARMSGFPSADTFGRNFKQKYALTPSQFRESGESVR